MPTDAEIIRHLAEKVMGWDYDESDTSDHRKDGDIWYRPCRLVDGVRLGKKRGNTSEWVIWNPLESTADCMEVQEKVMMSPHRKAYINRMYGEAMGGVKGIRRITVYDFLLTAPPRVRALAMYRATGGAE